MIEEVVRQMARGLLNVAITKTFLSQNDMLIRHVFMLKLLPVELVPSVLLNTSSSFLLTI